MKKSTGNADSLFLAAGEGVSEFAYFCVVTFWKAYDEVVDGRFAGGFHDLLSCCVWLSDRDVVGYGIMEQVGLLRYVAFHVAEMAGGDFPYIFVIYGNRSLIYIPETHEQFQECRLAGTAGSVDTGDLA